MKPGKIVSGQEADKTNLLLQALATVIENEVNIKICAKLNVNAMVPTVLNISGLVRSL